MKYDLLACIECLALFGQAKNRGVVEHHHHHLVISDDANGYIIIQCVLTDMG